MGLMRNLFRRVLRCLGKVNNNWLVQGDYLEAKKLLFDLPKRCLRANLSQAIHYLIEAALEIILEKNSKTY